MTTAKLRVSSLDYAAIRQSFIDYLQTTPEFTDYNFQASGLSSLIDLLAYNAHYQSLQANFLANEMYLDTAVKRSSIVSRAKELGYVPQSTKSAKATINVQVTNVQGNPSSLVLPVNSLFTASINSTTYTFVTLNSYTTAAVYTNGQYVYNFSNVDVYEGLYSQNTFVFNTADPKVIIPNVDIDVSTLRVWVTLGSTAFEFSKGAAFLNSDLNSKIYFTQEGYDQTYQVYFGDNVIGMQPTNGATIVCTYLVTSGNSGNDASVFSMSSAIPGATNATVAVSTVSPSAGGAPRETDQSVRLNALNQYGTQNRAVVPNDYKALILAMGANVKSVHVWGGEQSNPPQYGTVIVCAQPNQGDYLTINEKNNITLLLKSKAVANTNIKFVDPDYLDVVLACNVVYDPTTLSVGTYDLQTSVANTIASYALDTLNTFNVTFRYSNLLKLIDATDVSILNNQTVVKVQKELTPTVFVPTMFKFTFGNALNNNSKTATLSSSTFYVPGSTFPMVMEDNGAGVINILYVQNGVQVVYASNVGTVDYVTGDVIINQITISGYDGASLNIAAYPAVNDIATSQNVVLRIQSKNVTVNTQADNTQ